MDMIRTPTPAERANLAPEPARSSTQCTLVPIGMKEIGMEFPGLKSICPFELKRVSPTSTPEGAGM